VVPGQWLREAMTCRGRTGGPRGGIALARAGAMFHSLAMMTPRMLTIGDRSRRGWLRVWLACGLAWMAAGCATSNLATVRFDTVGPTPGVYGLFGDPKGYLQVFSQTRCVDDGNIPYYPHTGYSVYNPDGKRAASCVNHVGNDDQTPMVLPLVPGRYVVYARAGGLGVVSVPVVIARGRLTVLFLEREGMPKKDLALLNGAPVVHAPDGRVIGCLPEGQ
jgi:hypothetical protein